MIVKNEEKVIERAMASALPLIDSYCIVDTGSTDKTKQIIAAFMDRHRICGVVHDRPWVSFGHNRTEAIDLARESYPDKHGLILDADDVIEVPDGYKLPDLTADQYDNPVVHAELRYAQPHVIRLAMPFYFEGATHEYLHCKAACVKSALPEMVYKIGGDGNARSTGTKFKRDIELLLKEIRRNPQYARSYFYLAQSYRDDGQVRKAFHTFVKRGEMVGWDEETYIAKLEAGKCAAALGMSDFEIAGRFLDAHEARPQRAEALFYLGRFLRQAENYVVAIIYADVARKIELPQEDRLFVETAIYEWHAQAEFAISAQRLGRHEEAIAANLAALAKCPEDKREWLAKNLAFSTTSIAAADSQLSLRVYPPDVGGVRSGLNVVLNGSYDVPGLEFDKPPTIVDIGAHVGSASVFFAWRFPGAKIYAYEPSPDNAQYCEQNVAGIAELTRCAIVGPGMPKEMMLYNGIRNTGQRSIYQLGEQRDDGVMVSTMCATDLPACDVLKCDAEGVELDILRAYPHLDGVRVVILEWHRVQDYHELRQWLPTLGFELVCDDAKGQLSVSDRNLIFVRKEQTQVQS